MGGNGRGSCNFSGVHADPSNVENFICTSIIMTITSVKKYSPTLVRVYELGRVQFTVPKISVDGGGGGQGGGEVLLTV